MYVYVLGADRGPYKVGFSKNPMRRLSVIQSTHDKPLKLVFSQRVASPSSVERRAHCLLRKHRLGGEWFDAPLDEIISAICAAERNAVAYGARTKEPVVAFRVPKPLLAGLHAYAAREQLTKSEVIRAAMEALVERRL